MGTQQQINGAVEQHNAARRAELEQQARERYTKALKSDLAEFYLGVVPNLDDELLAALQAFIAAPGPHVCNNLSKLLHERMARAVARHVAAFWEPQGADGRYVAGGSQP